MPGSLVRTRSSLAAARGVPSATQTCPAWMDRPMPTPPPWCTLTHDAPEDVLTSALRMGQSAMASEPSAMPSVSRYGERHLAGLAFNDLVARGEVRAPIVIGRDHLDCGSVASPYRETEAMADGSDAIADWPILNALVNTASGASWVSVHHGGGVGIGRSIHAGQVCVADGSPLAGAKLERVLTNDPGMGVMRHADAGYDEASQVARDRGVRVPMDELPGQAS